MSEAEPKPTNQPDPMKQFRELRDAYLGIWSKNLIDAVNTEGYAQASGATLDAYLNVAGPYKEAAEQAMLRTLQQLNMPSSVDFAGLAGRFTNIEMQLDNLDAKLDRIENLLTDVQREAAPAADVKPPAKISPNAAEQASASRSAKKRLSKKQSGVRTGGNSIRTITAKPQRRNAKKGAK